MSRSMSGIAILDEVGKRFNDIKLKPKGQESDVENKFKFTSFCINDDKSAVIIDPDEKMHKKVPKGVKFTLEEDRQVFNDLKKLLDHNKPRYILYDFDFDNSEGARRQKLAFIYWCSDSCNVKSRMLYASTKDSVTQTCTGTAWKFEITDQSDFDYDEMTKVKSGLN